MAGLRERGIGAAAHYPTPAHLQPAWRSLGYEAGTLPAAERASARALSLPLFPGMTEVEVDLVVEALGGALSAARAG
jgi:dTDP-4-amino-4,6-dideoxygalactose transaminase